MALNTVNGKPIEFYVGTAEQYQAAINAGTINNKAFYLVFSNTTTDKCKLYVGANAISVDIDSALSDVSENAVSNKVVSKALAQATEIINNTEGVTTNAENVGKFIFTGNDITETYTLVFQPTVGKTINLIPAIKYDEASTEAMSGMAVAEAIGQAITDADIFEELDSVGPETATEKNKFYYEKGSGALYFNSTSLGLVELTNRAPIAHSSVNEDYGISTSAEYGHAKSGIATDANGKILTNAYVSRSEAKDENLVGDESTYKATFARVLHKHPLPALDAIGNDASSDEILTFNKKILSEDTYNFIKATSDAPYTYTEGTKTLIPASKRLTDLETDTTNLKSDYLSKSTSNAQTVNSNLLFKGNLSFDKESYLAVNVIAPHDYDGQTSSGGTITFKSSITTDSGIICGGSLSAGATTIEGALNQAGAVNIGKFNNVFGISVTGDNSSNAAITLGFNASTKSISASGNIDATGIITGNNLVALNQLTAGALYANTSLVRIGGSSKTDAYFWTESGEVNFQNLSKMSISTSGSDGLMVYGNTDFQKLKVSTTLDIQPGTTVTFKNFELTMSEVETNSNIQQRFQVGENKVLYIADIDNSDGKIATYVSGRLASYQPAGSYVSTATIQNTYNAESGDPISGQGVAQALASFNTVPFVASNGEPENTNILWIDTSIANGALKYYNGTEWVLVSAVWS